MSSRRLLTVLATLLLVSGCASDDPTAPREVRPVEPVDSDSRPEVPQAQDSPTRGLPCDEQPGAVRLCGAATDNYKASFNADPDAPELRTWLAVHELELRGARYEPAPGQELIEETIDMVALDDTSKVQRVQLAAQVVSGPGEFVRFRIGPQVGLWGPLLQLQSVPKLEHEPVVVELRELQPQAGEPAATLRLTYTWDKDLANAPTDSLEHGGPSGRWRVGSQLTGTNLELGWE